MASTIYASTDKYICPRLTSIPALVLDLAGAGSAVNQKGIATLTHGVLHGWGKSNLHLLRYGAHIGEDELRVLPSYVVNIFSF